MSAAVILLMVSLTLGLVAFGKAYRFLLSRARRKGGADLADLAVSDWPGLIGLLLPRSVRGGWNLLVLIVTTGLLSIPHWLTIWNVAYGPEALHVALIAYAVTLPYWLFLLFLPAAVLARRQAGAEATRDLTAN